MAHKLGPGIISGVVSEDGVPKSGGIVSIYDRDTGKEVKRVACDPAGAYTVSGLNPDTDSYYVVAQDDDGATRKNALIQDYVQPINGAVGSSYEANWYLEVKKLCPFYNIIGIPRTSTGTFINIYLSCSNEADQLHAAAIELGSVTVANAGLLGATNLQLITTSGAMIRARAAAEWVAPARGVLNITVSGSLFTIIDTTATNLTFIFAGRGTPYRLFSLHVSGFVITVSTANSGAAHVVLLSYTIPVGAGRSGLHSVACSVDTSVGGVNKIFLDGVEVASVINVTERIPNSFSTGNVYTAAYQRLSMMGIAVTDTYEAQNSGTSVKLVAALLFLSEMTATQSLTLHNSFFVAQPPQLTGYAKEVATDLAAAYYPLTCVGQQYVSDPFRGNYTTQAKMPHATFVDLTPAPTTTMPTVPVWCPVLGEAGLPFNGNTCFKTEMDEVNIGWIPSGLDRWTITLETWINLTQAPATTGA